MKTTSGVIIEDNIGIMGTLDFSELEQSFMVIDLLSWIYIHMMTVAAATMAPYLTKRGVCRPIILMILSGEKWKDSVNGLCLGKRGLMVKHMVDTFDFYMNTRNFTQITYDALYLWYTIYPINVVHASWLSDVKGALQALKLNRALNHPTVV